ncbi:MAG: NHLP leader peptide family RiPP precursor [Desulfomonilaceae bacterium]
MQETNEKWARIVIQAWADEGFKNRLLADPKVVLKENGIDFPESIKVNISEDKEDEINLTLPPKPNISRGEEWLLSGPFDRMQSG